MGRELGFFGRNGVQGSTPSPEQGTSTDFSQLHLCLLSPAHPQAQVGKEKLPNAQTNVPPSSAWKPTNNCGNNNCPSLRGHSGTISLDSRTFPCRPSTRPRKILKRTSPGQS